MTEEAHDPQRTRAKLQRPASYGSWRPPMSERLKPGTVFDERYSIGELIGGGATGNVYAATRIEDEAPVALKVIHGHLIGNRQVNLRFHREAEVLRKLTSPNIVRVHDFGEEASGLLYLALERLDGVPLGTLLEEHRELPLDQVGTILLGVCSAMQEAHKAGIVHRDLKPDNVVVLIDQETVVRVAVLDFGLSKMLQGKGLGSTNLTEQNMVLGTPEYMAPEQARGDEVDDRCDIYAAGVILYLLLAGQVPFKRRSPMAVMTAHLTEEPEEPRFRPSGRPVPSSLVAVAMHALAKRRRDRYPDAAALADALRKALQEPDDPRSVRPPVPKRDSIPQQDTKTEADRDIGHADTLPVVSGMSRPPSIAPVKRESATSLRWWIVVVVVAGLAGITLGVLVGSGW